LESATALSAQAHRQFKEATAACRPGVDLRAVHELAGNVIHDMKASLQVSLESLEELAQQLLDSIADVNNAKTELEASGAAVDAADALVDAAEVKLFRVANFKFCFRLKFFIFVFIADAISCWSAGRLRA
jgi:hypothetical protein